MKTSYKALKEGMQVENLSRGSIHVWKRKEREKTNKTQRGSPYINCCEHLSFAWLHIVKRTMVTYQVSNFIPPFFLAIHCISILFIHLTTSLYHLAINWTMLFLLFKMVQDYPKFLHDSLEMLQEQPEMLQQGDLLGERGQNFLSSLANVRGGPPKTTSSLIHSI